MALTLDDLFASPDHYLHSFEADAAVFVPMDRAAYHRSIFLDGRIEPASNATMRLPLSAMAGHSVSAAPTSWIFHVAHCGSTLLARALDDPDGNLVLREPLALRQLAVTPDRARLALIMAMLSKRYHADMPTLVKANVPVNFLLGDLVARHPQARAIFLHYPLHDYLLAILRDDDHRIWLRNVVGLLSAYLGDLSRLSDAECAAALWLAQMQAFAAAIEGLPNARSLDAERFFAAPRPVLVATARHLEIAKSDSTIDATVGGPLFATYSKNPDLAFDNAARVARRDALAQSLATELAQARHWIERRAGEAAASAEILARAALDC